MIPFLSSLSLVKLDSPDKGYNINKDNTLVTQLSLAELFKSYLDIKDDNNLLETISFEKVPENQLLNLSYKFIRKHITE